MTTFLIIRHGRSKSNEHGCFTGQTDVPLDEVGVKQAEQTASYLYKNYTIDFLYSSPLLRACDTAKPIAKRFNLPVRTENGLKEIDGGAWEEKTPEQILRLYKDDYIFWLNDIGEARCTSGENMREVQTRASVTLTEIAKQHDGKTVAVITHAGVIRSLQCLWQNLPLSEMKNIPWVENASISVVRFDHGSFYAEQIGFDKHLTE